MLPFHIEKVADTAEALTVGAGNESEPRVATPTQYFAGGTTLLDLMKLGVLRPATLVNINGLKAEHGAIEISEGGVRLGALVRMSEAADHPTLRRDYPVLTEALWKAASPQLRNMASLGGNVLQRTRCNYFRDPSWDNCNKRRPGSGCAAINGVNRRLAVLGTSEHCIANYPGDLAIALTALGAIVEIVGSDEARRTMPFEELHRLPGDTPHIETNLHPGDLITGFRVPAGAWTRRSLYLKIRDRDSYDFALASAAVALDLDAAGTVRTARIALGGLAAKPWPAHEAEESLTGHKLDETSAARCAEIALAGAVSHSETAFKVELGRRTLVRALLAAAEMQV